MEQRLVRAKRKIKQAGIPYEIPGLDEFPARLNGVLKVIYLIFNEGYSATNGPELLSISFCNIGIHLGRQVARLRRGQSEILGLLSLMLLQHSRAGARVDLSGEMVLLADQDRALWDNVLIQEGCFLLDKALALKQRPGPYQVQAAIAAIHASASSSKDTDWNEILSLYNKLVELQPTSIVRLNRAVALAMAQDAHAGIKELNDLASDKHMLGFYLYHSTRGALYIRADRYEEALLSYQTSLGLAKNEREQAFIRRQIDIIQNRGVTPC
jgi:RNA polymerase sigma-70 factor (ECF subfamily)